MNTCDCRNKCKDITEVKQFLLISADIRVLGSNLGLAYYFLYNLKYIIL